MLRPLSTHIRVVVFYFLVYVAITAQIAAATIPASTFNKKASILSPPFMKANNMRTTTL
ncbi:hypothetical protein TVCOMph1_CDS0030 [Terrisporobacter phage TVCOM_ph1]